MDKTKIREFIHSFQVFVFGGIEIQNKSQTLLNEILIFEIDFHSFSVQITEIEYNQKQNIASPRCSSSVQMMNDSKILIFGGLTSLNCFCNEQMMNDSTVYIFDFVNKEWQILQCFNDGPLRIIWTQSLHIKGPEQCIFLWRN